MDAPIRQERLPILHRHLLGRRADEIVQIGEAYRAASNEADTDLFDDALIERHASATNWITIAVNKVMAVPPRFLRFTGRMLVG